MPFYCYSNPDNPKEIIEIIQGIHDIHEYEQDGVKWDRVFTVPYAHVKDSPIDPFSQQDFLAKTQGKKDTFGDIWDRSREMSEKRKEKLGKDPVQEQNEKDYSKKRRGKKMPKNRNGEIAVKI